MRSGVVQELARVVSAKDSMLIDVPGLREFLVQDDLLGGKLRRLHAEVSLADLRPPTRRRARVRRPRLCGQCPAFIEPQRIWPSGKGVVSRLSMLAGLRLDETFATCRPIRRL